MSGIKRVARGLALEVVVGAFVVLVFAGLGLFTIVLTRQKWMGDTYEYEMVFDNVMGLRDGDSVVVRGMPIGTVDTLELDPAGAGVKVRVSLDEELCMREGYSITIISTSILGGRHLEVYEGPLTADLLPAGTILKGASPHDLMSDAADVVAEIKEALTTGGIIRDVQGTFSNLNAVAARLNEGDGTLGRLLSADDTLYEDFSAAVSSIRTIIERIESGKGSLGKLASEDATLYDDFAAAVKSLRNIVEHVDSGQGVLGHLIKDEDLYNDVVGIVEEIRATVDDYRETTPVVSFSSIWFGAF